jgi:hypothetical protein
MYYLSELSLPTITNYQISFSNSSSTKTIESLGDITDHISKNPIKISFTATITEFPEDKRGTLIKMRDYKRVLTFKDGKNLESIDNMIITNLTLPEEGYENGFIAQIELQQIRIIDSDSSYSTGENPETNENVQSEPDKLKEKNVEEESAEEDEVPEESWSSWLYKSVHNDESEEGDTG